MKKENWFRLLLLIICVVILFLFFLKATNEMNKRIIDKEDNLTEENYLGATNFTGNMNNPSLLFNSGPPSWILKFNPNYTYFEVNRELCKEVRCKCHNDIPRCLLICYVCEEEAQDE